MNSRHTLRTAVLLILLAALLHSQSKSAQDKSIADSTSRAQTTTDSPGIVDYQGFISSIAGEPVSGSLSATFSLWDDAAAGNRLWRETQSLDVRLGHFTASLGAVAPLPENIFTGVRWLEIEIAGERLTPRKRINSVAHALHAANAASLNGQAASSFYTKAQANSSANNEIDAAHLGGVKAAEYLTKNQANAQYIQKVMSNTITSNMIVDGTIQRQDMGFELGDGGGTITQIVAENGLEGGGSQPVVRIGLTAGHQSGQAYDQRFPKRGEMNSVTGVMIADNDVTSADIQNGTIQPNDLAFTAGTINQVVAGSGLQGGGTIGSVTLSLADNYKSGVAYDTRFVPRSEAGITSSMIRDGEITSLDIQDGTIREQDMAFAAGDITAVRGANGIVGETLRGDALLTLEPAYQSGAAYDSRFIKRGQESAVNSLMIVNGSILQEDMGFAAGDITSVTTSGGITGGGMVGDLHLELEPAYKTGSAYDMLFVKENQFEAITTQMIKDGQVQSNDIAHGSIQGHHVGDFSVQQDKAGAVISATNQAYSANTSGVEGRGYQGLRGIGTHTGLYAEGSTYGVHAKATNSQNYGLYVEGKAHCTSGEWGDVAEYVPSDEELEPGDVVVIDSDQENAIKRCRQAADTRVAGIISTAPTITVGQETADGKYALALAGIVPCKVVATEPIRPGDLLTTAAVPGHAQKATDAKIGTIVGKALEGLPTGAGVIKVLVTLQ
ncbi:hypothetical protein JW998_08070 [candidate division KSB1 bacterium]|nr:hypothetical protein [candidate division KSB1 bacterium]